MNSTTGIFAVEFVPFCLSRTIGLPGGYQEGWIGAPEDLLGMGSLLVELVFIGCAVTSLTTTARTGHHAPTRMPIHDRTAPLP